VEHTVEIGSRIEVRGGSLRLQGDERPGAAIDVGTEPVLVGRDASCQLALRDPRVSSLHAELVATSLGTRLRDLGSLNGTWVQGLRVIEACLRGDARIQVGDTQLEFRAAAVERVRLGRSDRFGPLYGTSAPMRRLFDRVGSVAATELSVLVQGETGTGKELVAQAIHQASERRAGPFVVIDCAAIPASLAEAHLFGHERGAFTGATARRESPFVEAHGGTVFLDELGELPLELQPRLLRALAEKRIRAVGASRYRTVDARVVAASRRDLAQAVNEGTFRSDLFFRVAQIRLDVPPLRERLEDVPGLVRHVLATLGAEQAFARVPSTVLERLMRHDWPGNVRELRNAVCAAFALARPSEALDVAAFVGDLARGAREPAARVIAGNYHDRRREELARFERDYFSALHQAAAGNVSQMARVSGLERVHVRAHLKRLGLIGQDSGRRRRA
jgi:DNA-binding NtrC family response regulator